MKHFAKLPARPRSTARRPAYPAMSALGAALLVSACAGNAGRSDATSPSTAAPVQVVVPSTPSDTPDDPQGGSADPLSADELVMGAPERFPEDDAEPPMVGCGGHCPPAYVLATRAKDRTQIEARVRYCANRGRQLLDAALTLEVRATIDEAGAARNVAVESEGEVPPTVRSCIERLVAVAPFEHEPPFERTTGTSTTVTPKDN